MARLGLWLNSQDKLKREQKMQTAATHRRRWIDKIRPATDFHGSHRAIHQCATNLFYKNMLCNPNVT